MPLPLNGAFWTFVLLIVLNFFLIFSGLAGTRFVAAAFTTALLFAGLLLLAGDRSGRVIALIVLVLDGVMAILLAQQFGIQY